MRRVIARGTSDKAVLFSGEEKGAIDIDKCPTRYRGECYCGEICARCGWAIHASVHGPIYGKKPGTKPYGHVFVKKS
jgi:hypothetical protein